MFLSIKPSIVTMNERRIHVIRKPGLVTWLLLALSSIVFIAVSERLSKNLLYLIILILGEIVLSLDTFGEWQELLLDRELNKAAITKCSWRDKFFCGTDKVRVSMKLTDIRHVGVSIGMGLFLIHKNGQTISLSMQGFGREELQKLRREIDYFLNMNQPDPAANVDSFPANEFVQSPVQAQLLSPVSANPLKQDDTLANDKRWHLVRCNLSLPIISENNENRGCRCSLRKSIHTNRFV